RRAPGVADGQPGARRAAVRRAAVLGSPSPAAAARRLRAAAHHHHLARHAAIRRSRGAAPVRAHRAVRIAAGPDRRARSHHRGSAGTGARTAGEHRQASTDRGPEGRRARRGRARARDRARPARVHRVDRQGRVARERAGPHRAARPPRGDAVTRSGPWYGGWIERLEALAVGRDVVAVAGRRDAAGEPSSQVHVIPTTLLDGKGAGWSLDPGGGAVHALAFAGDELLLGGGDRGRLVAWDVTGKRRVAELDLGAPVRSLALDAAAARGDAGALAVGTADGALHIIGFEIRDAAPVLGPPVRRALSDGAIGAVAWDPAGLWLAGGADGQLWVIDEKSESGGRGSAGGGGVRPLSIG